jgi:hypothetical protein
VNDLIFTNVSLKKFIWRNAHDDEKRKEVVEGVDHLLLESSTIEI